MSFKGVTQLKLVNGTVTSNAYQDNIISDLDHLYGCPMSQAFNKIAHLAKALQNIQTFTWDQGSDVFGLAPKLKFIVLLHPPGRKTWLLFSVWDMSWCLRNQCFTKFSMVDFM